MGRQDKRATKERGVERKGRVKEGMWGERTHTKDFLKAVMNIYYCRSFLKYKHIL